jgi:hypothetical protein
MGVLVADDGEREKRRQAQAGLKEDAQRLLTSIENELDGLRRNGSDATARAADLIQQVADEIRAVLRHLPE